MLISHRKSFIFLKTLKTAGTSIESYFEQYCMPEGEWQESHLRNEYVSETGIIGQRGDEIKAAQWYNHMLASLVRELIEPEIWNDYFKFTAIRNPFDKLISLFFNSRQVQTMMSNRPNDKSIIELFRFSIRQAAASINRGNQEAAIVDRDKYIIDGKECVDYFIRFEDLHDGMKTVCERLFIPFEPARIPAFKTGIRHRDLAIQDYYDDQTEQIARQLYSWEFERFGYALPQP